MKAGEKYVIEVEKVVDGLAKIKGFNALVFDCNGLEKLKPLDGYYTEAELQEACDRARTEAKAELTAQYMRSRVSLAPVHQIRRGDEVEYDGLKMIVTKTYADNGYFDAILHDGTTFNRLSTKDVAFTGKHFKLYEEEVNKDEKTI